MKTVSVLLILGIALGFLVLADAAGLSPLGDASALGADLNPCTSICVPPNKDPCLLLALLQG